MFYMFRLVVRYEHEIKEHRMGSASETFAVKAELVFFVCGMLWTSSPRSSCTVAIFSLGL